MLPLPFDPLIPFALIVIALLCSGVIIMCKPDRTAAWSVRVLAIALSAVIVLVLTLTILDALIPGPPFIMAA